MSIAHELAALLGTVRTPGDFCTAGTIELGLPPLPMQADQLVDAADRAPYRSGAETVVDASVRRPWKIGAERVRIEGTHWARTLQPIVEWAATGLGVTTALAARLYKLLAMSWVLER